MPRPACPRCLRPVPLCLCADIPSLDNTVRVLVLQHPDEARHALNTARLAVLGLKHGEMVAGTHFDAALWERAGRDCYLLFPGEAAKLARDMPAPIEGGREQLLIVPDGTWRHARALLRDNPALAALPRITLGDTAVTRYRVRHADAAGALSTIEAISEALGALERTPRYEALLAPFERLVSQQIAAMGEDVYQRHHVERVGTRGKA
ncbi:tRNA-uridine aminocarboxypropyltransferase [Pseudomonadota bacterium AL_CKDN230030165-1A_HGKHYDSX7]